MDKLFYYIEEEDRNFENKFLKFRTDYNSFLKNENKKFM